MHGSRLLPAAGRRGAEKASTDVGLPWKNLCCLIASMLRRCSAR